MLEITDLQVLMFGSIGMPELFFIFLIVLLIFGAKRLPEIARSIGKAINEFRKTKDDIMNYDDDQSVKKVSDAPSKELPEDTVANKAEKVEEVDPKKID